MPATESFANGEVVPTPTLPPVVAKYAEPVAVKAVVEAYEVMSFVPSKVSDDESVKAPAVVMKGTRPEVSEEAVRFVEEAVPK